MCVTDSADHINGWIWGLGGLQQVGSVQADRGGFVAVVAAVLDGSIGGGRRWRWVVAVAVLVAAVLGDGWRSFGGDGGKHLASIWQTSSKHLASSSSSGGGGGSGSSGDGD